MRVAAHQPPLPFEDHAVLVVEGRIFDRDGDVARRQPRIVDRLDARHGPAAFLVEAESSETGHAYARSGSRMLTKLATAAPPIFITPASCAFGICMSPACPLTCIEPSTC